MEGKELIKSTIIKVPDGGKLRLILERDWIKGLLIATGITGVTFAGTVIVRKFVISSHNSTSKNNSNSKSYPVNGHAKKSNTDQVDQYNRQLNASTASDINTYGDLFDFPYFHGRGSNWSRSRNSTISSSTLTRRRRRSGSINSAATVSLLVNKNPTELIDIGLESLRKAARFLEESKAKILGSRERSIDSEFEFILSKTKQLIDNVEEYINKDEKTPEFNTASLENLTTIPSKMNSSVQSFRSEYESDIYNFENDQGTIASAATLPFFDIEPNIHFFKFYTQALEMVDGIPPPRVDRTVMLELESEVEFRAKVQCIRDAFTYIFEDPKNHMLFEEMGREILSILLTHSLRDPTECLESYAEFLELVSDAENHEVLLEEIKMRKIPCFTFYDLVLDYIILDSFEDLEDPPKAVLSVANNRWLSAGFRELALQTAVSAVLRHKRSKLAISNGFFSHFYDILDHISPILAWGFLGTDYELGYKCNLLKESLLTVCRDYFSFDRVRYTSIQDASIDLLNITKEAYDELKEKLNA